MSFTHGMDVGSVDDLARLLQTSADRLHGIVGDLDRLVGGTPWSGDDGGGFLQGWPTHKDRLLRAAEGLLGLGQAARSNIGEQIRTSAAAVGGGAAAAPGSRSIDRTIDGHRAGGTHPTSYAFADYISRIEDVADENAFELLQVSVDPPRYLVLLPGIELEDLSFWSADTLRDLETAVPARLLDRDAYAARVMYELERAGVPAGAEVMLMGHSYGAIAAMNLASDPQFNQPGNGASTGPYHVQVTHVVAAGAGLRDWIDRPPAGTDVLLSINRRDHVATSIQAGSQIRGDEGYLDSLTVLDELPGVARMAWEGQEHVHFGAVAEDVHRAGDGRIVQEFTAANDESGHHYENYRTGLNAAGSQVGTWTDDAARKYFSGNPTMVSTRIEVFDPRYGGGGGGGGGGGSW